MLITPIQKLEKQQIGIPDMSIPNNTSITIDPKDVRGSQ